MRNQLQDIGEFAHTAARHFQESQDCEVDKRFQLGLSIPTVESLVRNAFFASLVPNEGRFPSVSMMTYVPKQPELYQFSFAEPIDVTASNIASLAPSVSANCHLCLLSNDDRLLLDGIRITLPDELRQFGYSSFRIANPLKLVIHGPGHIEFSTGSIALIYKGGMIVEEKPLQHAEVMRILAERVRNELSNRTCGTIESIEDVFHDLIRTIVRLNHGGLLLVSKSFEASQFSSSRALKSAVLHELLIEYWNSVSNMLQNTNGVAGVLAAANQSLLGRHFVTISSNTAKLEKCVESISHLAGIDGAIVLDYACHMRAFNAIISRDPESRRKVRLMDTDGREIDAMSIKNHGSRHQSAVSFVSRVPDSIAFVISQDGSVSALCNKGDGTVVYEPGLRVFV